MDKMTRVSTFEIDVEKLVNAFYLWEKGETEEALLTVNQLSLTTHNNSIYHLLYIIFKLQTSDSSNNEELAEVGQQAIALAELRGFKLIEAYCRILLLERVPNEERLLHISNLKYQFAAYGYTNGLGALSRKYG